MSDGHQGTGSTKQSDTLLWLAAALVVGIGLVWLLISQPWSSGSSSATAAMQTRPSASAAAAESAPGPGAAPRGSAATADPQPTATRAGRAGGLDDPLRMAELAYEAGMLIEPEGYSAWALFAKALEAEPGSAAALDGLNKVADNLIVRGESAVEQGRFDDAKATATLISETLPDHEGARALIARIEELSRPAEPAPARRAEAPTPPRTEIEAARASAPTPAPVRMAETPALAPAPQIDPVEEMHEAFGRAMAGNRLLTPASDNARHHLERMLDAAPDHRLTQAARDLLVTEMLARSAQATEALDTEAAQTWIDEAETFGGDSIAVEAARERLTSALIALESAKRLPASEFTVLNYVAPAYPRNALYREIEGWVDVEFTVAADGTTQNIAVADGSHDTYFHDEAVGAVAQWRFEPRIFLDRPISQQTYTRLRFVLGDE